MLEIGSLVDGKYKILNKVGQGGMSVVYMAINEKANKTWAVKEVRKDGVLNFESVKQGLVAETNILKKLSHPNLPSIIDVIDTEDSFIIIMDYVQGNSLNKALEEYGAQPQEYVIEWAKQLCDVLGYLHSRQPPIIYRDMKPANIMIKPTRPSSTSARPESSRRRILRIPPVSALWAMRPRSSSVAWVRRMPARISTVWVLRCTIWSPAATPANRPMR